MDNYPYITPSCYAKSSEIPLLTLGEPGNRKSLKPFHRQDTGNKLLLFPHAKTDIGDKLWHL